MRNSLLSLLFALTLTTNAYAIFCPTNFTSISLGDSLDHVISQCGQPSEVKRYQANGNVLQQWTYFVHLNGYENTTVKLTVLVANNQVANIILDSENLTENADCQGVLTGNSAFQAACQMHKQSNEQSLASTPICGFPIKIGDSGQSVQAACGKPVMVQQIQQDTMQSDPLEMAELYYAGPPRVMLSFKNNRLEDRKFI